MSLGANLHPFDTGLLRVAIGPRENLQLRSWICASSSALRSSIEMGVRNLVSEAIGARQDTHTK